MLRPTVALVALVFAFAVLNNSLCMASISFDFDFEEWNKKYSAKKLPESSSLNSPARSQHIAYLLGYHGRRQPVEGGCGDACPAPHECQSIPRNSGHPFGKEISPALLPPHLRKHSARIAYSCVNCCEAMYTSNKCFKCVDFYGYDQNDQSFMRMQFGHHCRGRDDCPEDQTFVPGETARMCTEGYACAVNRCARYGRCVGGTTTTGWPKYQTATKWPNLATRGRNGHRGARKGRGRGRGRSMIYTLPPPPGGIVSTDATKAATTVTQEDSSPEKCSLLGQAVLMGWFLFAE